MIKGILGNLTDLKIISSDYIPDDVIICNKKTFERLQNIINNKRLMICSNVKNCKDKENGCCKHKELHEENCDCSLALRCADFEPCKEA